LLAVEAAIVVAATGDFTEARMAWTIGAAAIGAGGCIALTVAIDAVSGEHAEFAFAAIYAAGVIIITRQALSVAAAAGATGLPGSLTAEEICTALAVRIAAAV
jgi:hypothetical protein